MQTEPCWINLDGTIKHCRTRLIRSDPICQVNTSNLQDQTSRHWCKGIITRDTVTVGTSYFCFLVISWWISFLIEYHDYHLDGWKTSKLIEQWGEQGMQDQLEGSTRKKQVYAKAVMLLSHFCNRSKHQRPWDTIFILLLKLDVQTTPIVEECSRNYIVTDGFQRHV